MKAERLLDFAARTPEADCLIFRDSPWTYGALRERVQEIDAVLSAQGVGAGAIVSLEGDYSPGTIAALLALAERGCIAAPLLSATEERWNEHAEAAQFEFRVRVDGDDRIETEALSRRADHPLYVALREQARPGIVFFTSGSTGRSKAALHDFEALLEKFAVRRQTLRTLLFLRFDHMGGINTLLYQLSNGGGSVVPRSLSPADVLDAVQRHGVELLPTTPTFMNLMLLSDLHSDFDLSALKIVSYGTEPMPESTLRRFHAEFPGVRLRQTYGLSEMGVLRSQSREDGSLWVRLGGPEFETRVVEGALQIKAVSAMRGYLNAESPFTNDGWFITGDLVEQDGEYIRFLGRHTDVINVGGEKVFPAEVESVVQELPEVQEVRIFGESNAITGQIVCAEVVLRDPARAGDIGIQIKQHCGSRLAAYKVPVKIRSVDHPLHTDRYKKVGSARP